MQYSTNYNMNKPERADQYNLNHWNNNTDIIDTELKRNADAESALRNITDSTFKTALLNFCYPIGSLYWSSKSTDPSTLFGGTWTQIKDKFIWAKGDNDTVNSTGGAKTVTLTVENLPSHNHSFTPSGTVSSHSHGLNNHTHSFTPSGTVSSHKHALSNSDSSTNADDHTIFTGTAGTVSVSGGDHTHSAYVEGSSTPTNISHFYGPKSSYGILFALNSSSSRMYSKTNYQNNNLLENSGNLSMSGSFTPSGTVTGNTRSATPTFTGSAGTTGGSTVNTANATPTFTGSAGTTNSKGSGTAVNKMPPYIVKYCWERTA